jgi:hypothetical protein
MKLKKIISYSLHPEKRRTIWHFNLKPHLLLQGDFFLTSRCYPPQRKKSPDN